MAASKKMRNYLVIWTPRGIGIAVDQMKVVGAFASDGTKKEVNSMVAYSGDYRKYGEGNIFVVEQGDLVTVC